MCSQEDGVDAIHVLIRLQPGIAAHVTAIDSMLLPKTESQTRDHAT
jgi:hypothetical protein